jgi:nucleotide-binding universal stress UspA family protein
MTILIAYDASDCAKAAIADLASAALPPDTQATVLTVAEMQPAVSSSTLDPGYGASFVAAEALEDIQALTDAADREAKAAASEGTALLKPLFPGWTINCSTRSDPPAVGILDEAQRLQPDLIVVGSHGRSAVARVFYGSVSQKVVKYAATSVRVGRGKKPGERQEGPLRLILAFDGSPESHAALRAVAARRWPAGTQCRVLTAADRHIVSALPSVGGEPPFQALQRSSRLATERLQEIGLDAAPVIHRDDPKRVIVDEAENWNADCIFMGTHGIGRARRFLLGSAASVVVSRAICSVEVVRTPAAAP